MKKRSVRERIIITINWIAALAWVITVCSIDSEDRFFLARIVILFVCMAWGELFLLANPQYRS